MGRRLDGRTDGKHRIGVRIARVPGPATQAALVCLDEAGDVADRGHLDRTAQQMPPADAYCDLPGLHPGAWQGGPGAALAVQPDLGRTRHRRPHDEHSVAVDAAPAGRAGATGDRVRQRVGRGEQRGVRNVSRQRAGQGVGGPRRVVKMQARRGQAEPGRAYVLGLGDRAEQRLGAHIVAAQTGGRERQGEGSVMRRQPAGAIEPAHRRLAIAGHERLLAALLRLARQDDAVVGHVTHGRVRKGWEREGKGRERREKRGQNTPPPLEGGGWGEGCVRDETPPPNPLPQGEGECFPPHQRPTACASGAALAGAGNAARSPRASCRP